MQPMQRRSTIGEAIDIHDAAQRGRADLIPIFIKSEKDLNRKKNSFHILYRAVNARQTFFIKKLFEHIAANGWQLDFGKCYQWDHPFHLAVQDRFVCTQILATHLKKNTTFRLLRSWRRS